MTKRKISGRRTIKTTKTKRPSGKLLALSEGLADYEVQAQALVDEGTKLLHLAKAAGCRGPSMNFARDCAGTVEDNLLDLMQAIRESMSKR